MLSASRVAVLLCTYNGQDYLEQQIHTIAEQDFSNIDLYVSDDGSTDETLKLLAQAQAAWSKGAFEIFQGPQKGFAENFMSLVLNPAIQADYYAYSDQDDVWASDKVSTAFARIKDQQNPALYCSRTQLVDEQLKPLGYSPLFSKQPSFRNALVQCIGGGNTMLFNHAARALLMDAGVSSVPSHDWWTYLIVSGCGGVVLYDPIPRIAYRQHANNVLGSNQGFTAIVHRCHLVLKGNFRMWAECHSVLLEEVKHVLSGDAQHRLMFFQGMRSSSAFRRIYSFFKAGVYRQSLQGSFLLLVAVIIGKS